MLSLAFMNKNRIVLIECCKTFYIFCEFMETGELAQAAINILDWSWNITDVIWNPLNSSEWFFGTILNSSTWLRVCVIIFFFRLITLIYVIKDSNARSSSFWFQIISALIIVLLTPLFWLPLYIAIRPQWWKWDKIPRRDTLFQSIQACDTCGYFNWIENTYCTNCGEYLQVCCRECQNRYSKSYSYCPNCWAPNLPE